MAAEFSPDLAVGILREVIVALVRKDGPALSTHQLAVFLTCYLKEGDHTVRGLAAELNVSKSVITRALDRLGELDLARRRPDPADRRSVLVERTRQRPRNDQRAQVDQHGRGAIGRGVAGSDLL